MSRKRPCRICGRWFQPHPRAGPRQRVCSQPSCQRERHRRACGAWHGCNPDYDREARLVRRLYQGGGQQPEITLRFPERQLDWDVARDAVGLQVAVVLEEGTKVLSRWARDAVLAQRTSPPAVATQHLPGHARDAIANPQHVP